MSQTSLSLLRRGLAADAIGSGATAALLLIASTPLAAMLGVPSSLLTTIGLLLIPWVAWTGWLATRANPPCLQAWMVVGLNTLWVIESAVLLMSDWIEPTRLGSAFVIAQAIAVGVFAELQYMGLRRSAVRA
jgi:hypothetical protein